MYKERLKRIEAIFDDYETKGGVFSRVIQYPWSASIDCDTLNEMFVSEYGECIPSRYITRLYNNDDELSPEARKRLSFILATRYMKKWEKQWATLNFEYDPIANYDMKENETTEVDNVSNKEGSSYTTNTGENTTTYNLTDSTTGDSTQTNNLSDTNSFTHTLNLTDTQEITVQNTNSNTANQTESKYAFNSATAVPDNTTTQSKSDTINQNSEDVTEHTGTDTNAGTETHTGTITNENDTTTTKTGTQENDSEQSISVTTGDRTTQDGTTTRTLTRVGNIGVMTTQQMINAEREVYSWDFFKEVFHDIAKLIIIPIF